MRVSKDVPQFGSMAHLKISYELGINTTNSSDQSP